MADPDRSDELDRMAAFAPVTDAELARARSDSDFRQRLLQESLDTLLAGLRMLRSADAEPAQKNAHAGQIREAVELAVRLAELIQAPARLHAGR